MKINTHLNGEFIKRIKKLEVKDKIINRTLLYFVFDDMIMKHVYDVQCFDSTDFVELIHVTVKRPPFFLKALR